MRLLPSEQESRLQEAIDLFKEQGYLNIHEPCDCGDRVRHNNGGNYHDIIYLKKDSGRYFVKWTDTCELKADPGWDEVTSLEEIETIIKQYADWL